MFKRLATGLICSDLKIFVEWMMQNIKAHKKLKRLQTWKGQNGKMGYDDGGHSF